MLPQCLIVSGLTLLATLSALLHPQEWHFWLMSFVGIGELALSFHLVRENERVVPVFLGRIESEVGVTLTEQEKAGARPRPRYGLFGTGIAFFLFPFYRLRRYPMTVLQVVHDVGKVVTRPGEHSFGGTAGPTASPETRRLGPAELSLEVTLNFQFDMGNLAQAVANAPPPLSSESKMSAPEPIKLYAPEPIPPAAPTPESPTAPAPTTTAVTPPRPRSSGLNPEFQDLLRAELDEAIRSAAARRTWFQIYYERQEFEEAVESRLLEQGKLDHADSIFVKSGIRDRQKLRISLTQVNLPKALRESVNAEQEALFRAEATRRTAEAERYKREQEGQGLAEARKKLYDAIRGASRAEGDQNRLAEALVTLREMAQGQASTIFVPEVVTATLGQAFGEMRPQRILEYLFTGLTPQQKEQLLNEALQELRRGRGNR